MKGNPSSGGIWAPDLSYADGKFWLIYTDWDLTHRCSMMMTDANTLFSRHGIIANTTMLFDGITVTEFDTETMKLKPETARTIYAGTDVKLVEGPHLYKINGYYYLFAAQGGTVWTHQEVVARSKTLDALSFETEPLAIRLLQTLIRRNLRSRSRDMVLS